MKKTGILLLTAVAALSLTACTLAAQGTEGAVQPFGGESAAETSSTVPEEGEMRVSVSDVPLYRGTVLSIDEGEDGSVVTLAQAEGTDFGAPSLRFAFTADTTLSFEWEELAEGDYLEVYYGSREGQTLAEGELHNAIGANRYHSAEMVLCNGVLEQRIDEEEGKGTLLLRRLDNDQEILFHYTEETVFYLNPEEMKEGDRLNIFYSGVLARSLPPQGTALEVRPYAEPAGQPD